MSTRPEVVPVSDHGVLVVFDGQITDETRGRVHALDTALAHDRPAGMREVVPAMTTLLVVFDPLVTDHAAISDAVHANLERPATIATGATHVIDVCYDGEHAPDLAALAARAGVDTEATVAAHVAGTYTVGMYGFAPGYAYLYGTPDPIQQPRNPTPGPPVPAGSVIVAGQQCLIVPVAMSTGWFAIGRSSVSMYTSDEDRPFLFDIGDTVVFRRIGADELDARLAQQSLGAP
jgi:inhibitor of KinA